MKENEIIAELFYRATGEQHRAGDVGFLTATVTAQDVSIVLNEYHDRFPTLQDRQFAFDRLIGLGHVVAELKGKREAKEREAVIAKSQAEAEAKNASKRRR